MMTNSGKSGLALLLTVSGVRPNAISIGTGSAAVAVTRTGLITETKAVAFTSTDISVAQNVLYTADQNAIQMSGISLKEFGVKVSGSANAVWNIEGFPAVTFDGTSELQIQVNFNIF